MRVLTLRVSHIRDSQSQMRTPIPECGALIFLVNCTVFLDDISTVSRI